LCGNVSHGELTAWGRYPADPFFGFFGLIKKMEKWQWITLIVCAVGVFKEFRPSEPFVTEYLIEYKNFTKATVVHVAYPIATYTYLGTLPIVFLITDFLRYKTIIIFETIAFVLTYTLLIWGNGLANLKVCDILGIFGRNVLKKKYLQVVEVLYGLACSTEVAYYTYIYAKVDRSEYKKVTSYTHTAILIGNFVAAVLSQVLVSTKLMNYHQLNYLTLASVSSAFILSLFLPGVEKSMYFYRNITGEQRSSINEGDEEKRLRSTRRYDDLTYAQRGKRAYGMLWHDFKKSYSNAHVLKWSVWWAIASAGFVQVK
jgi:thiamine transporter 2/3